jgi:hypothetical protein
MLEPDLGISIKHPYKYTNNPKINYNLSVLIHILTWLNFHQLAKFSMDKITKLLLAWSLIIPL